MWRVRFLLGRMKHITFNDTKSKNEKILNLWNVYKIFIFLEWNSHPLPIVLHPHTCATAPRHILIDNLFVIIPSWQLDIVILIRAILTSYYKIDIGTDLRKKSSELSGHFFKFFVKQDSSLQSFYTQSPYWYREKVLYSWIWLALNRFLF